MAGLARANGKTSVKAIETGLGGNDASQRTGDSPRSSFRAELDRSMSSVCFAFAFADCCRLCLSRQVIKMPFVSEYFELEKSLLAQYASLSCFTIPLEVLGLNLEKLFLCVIFFVTGVKDTQPKLLGRV